jgi:hypothetical protein
MKGGTAYSTQPRVGVFRPYVATSDRLSLDVDRY